MKTFKINKRAEVVCDAQNTRNGFKHTATLLYDGISTEQVKCCYQNRTWESYEFESVLEKLLHNTTKLNDKEKKLFEAVIKNGGEHDCDDLKTVAMVAKLGEIFGSNQKEKNDWKARMLKAGLENKGLIMPEDWDILSEADKEARLNGAIAQLG